ncbi:MAG: hypothetical protein HFJ50_00370 [Clostridia bacterium]|nr:hypothetical protein [Clostridia bacterium]
MIKDGFDFSSKHSFLIPYNELSKRIMRNYEKIKLCMFAHLSKRHEVEYTDVDYMDFLVDNELYLKIMLFLDINHIAIIKNYLEIHPIYKDKMYFICFSENVDRLGKCIKGCNTIAMDKSTIDEFLEKDYIDFGNEKIDFPTI